MFKESLYPKTEQVLEKLSKETFIVEYYLAGGTALALQIGHRKSIDLDFFTEKSPKIETLIQNLQPLRPKVINQNENSLDVVIDDVKVSFLEYHYKLINKFEDYNGVRLASIEDIGSMKLTAISSRGTKKDFIDLYFILKQMRFSKLLYNFDQKYMEVDYSLMHLFKSLMYFKNADANPDVDYLNTPEKWETIKTYFLKEIPKYLKSLPN